MDDEPDIFPTLEDAQAEAASSLENEIEMALAALTKRINYKLEKYYNQLCQEIRNRN
jgi:hypothetical protein